MTKDQCLQQLNDLFLTDPETSADLVFCSPLESKLEGFNSFDLMNVETGQKSRVIFKITEID